MKNIVVLAGSFNPITKAHRAVLESAVNRIGADLGLFVITNNSYLNKKIIVDRKSKRPFILSEEAREEMISSLNDMYPKLKFGGKELGGESPSTYKTFKAIQRKYKGYKIHYLIGADKLAGIPNWSNAAEIIDEFGIIVFPRAGIDLDGLIGNNELLKNNKNNIIKLDEIDEIANISSTKLRELFFNDQDYSIMMDEGPYNVMKKYTPSDFKELSAEDMIKSTLIYGGRFSGNLARKLVYNENTRLFNSWDNTRFGDKAIKVNNTRVYSTSFNVNSDNCYDTVFSCVNSDCADVALDLINEGLNPAILNLASNTMPCGGYRDGTNAQEESLCYMSTLSQSLLQFANAKLKIFKESNLINIPNVYPLDINYGGIYSPNVVFFRNNIDKYYSLRENIFECGIISVASLANTDYLKYCDDDSKYFNGDLLNNKGIEIEKNKIRTILRIGLDNNHDSLILGAFGCGVYHLDCNQVVNLFNEVFNEIEFKNKFKKIVFAIYEGAGSSRRIVGENGKFKPFYDIFKK